MAEIVNVTIPVDSNVAAELNDTHKREAVGRVVSRMLQPHKDFHPLLKAMAELGAEAQRRGLTQEILDEEIESYYAEQAGENSHAA